MVFAVDAGNTNIVVGGLCTKDDIRFTARLATDQSMTSDQYAAQIGNILKLYKIREDEITGAIISTVVPVLAETLSSAIRLLFGIDPLVVGRGIDCGLDVKGVSANDLGADLICAAVGALDMYQPPLIIFDFGTATTVTAIDKDGIFRGGSIIPGVKISLGALSSTAALLRDIDLDSPEIAPISLDTAVCMRSGILIGSACMMDGMIERYRHEIGENAAVIATGGLAGVIVPNCKTPGIILDRNLLLRGLYIIYIKNQNRL